MKGYTVEHDKMLSKIHGYKVYRYTCNNCGEEIACNGNFDKKPRVAYCKFCGNKLED